MEANGFKVFVNLGGTQEMKKRFGIAPDMSSCHSARVGGYAIEGHVPASDIKRLLRETPAVVGLAAPACRSAPRAWTRPRTAARWRRMT